MLKEQRGHCWTEVTSVVVEVEVEHQTWKSIAIKFVFYFQCNGKLLERFYSE